MTVNGVCEFYVRFSLGYIDDLSGNCVIVSRGPEYLAFSHVLVVTLTTGVLSHLQIESCHVYLLGNARILAITKVAVKCEIKPLKSIYKKLVDSRITDWLANGHEIFFNVTIWLWCK